MTKRVQSKRCDRIDCNHFLIFNGFLIKCTNGHKQEEQNP